MSINNSAVAAALLWLQSDIFRGHVLATALVAALVSVIGALALAQAAPMKTIGVE